jgi:hypothetical protein
MPGYKIEYGTHPQIKNSEGWVVYRWDDRSVNYIPWGFCVKESLEDAVNAVRSGYWDSCEIARATVYLNEKGELEHGFRATIYLKEKGELEHG